MGYYETFVNTGHKGGSNSPTNINQIRRQLYNTVESKWTERFKNSQTRAAD